jgi:hypothetical protein
MATIRNNPLIKGIRGMIGKTIVFRVSRNGETLISNRPRKSGVSTSHQQYSKQRFLKAVSFAKDVMKNPKSKAEYEIFTGHQFTSAYSVAVADFLKSPEIAQIQVSNCDLFQPAQINIVVIDYFPAQNVSVEIRSASNELIEIGEANLQQGSSSLWVYATTRNAIPGGSIVNVTAKDKPGNVTVKALVIA